MKPHPIALALAAATLATLALTASPAHASLVARNLDSDDSTAEAYYDTTLGITWMRDRNHLAGVTPGMVSTGLVTWADGDAAIAALNASSTAGYGLSGWRMPTAGGVASIAGAGCQFGFNGSTDCGSNVDTSSSRAGPHVPSAWATPAAVTPAATCAQAATAWTSVWSMTRTS
jgi:hypothetical protein